MFHRMGRPMSPPIQHNDNKNHLTHLHKTQKHSITTTHSLPRASRATVFQNLLNRYAGAKYICFGDALGQNVKSAPRYLPVARRHQKNLFSSYLHLTPFDISPR